MKKKIIDQKIVETETPYIDYSIIHIYMLEQQNLLTTLQKCINKFNLDFFFHTHMVFFIYF